MRSKRVLGKELIKFVDGEEKEYTIHAVSNFEMMRLRRVNRKTTLDKKGSGISSIEFQDDEFVLQVLKLAIGSEISFEDLKDVETDLKGIYDKYFNVELAASKKLKLSDMSDPAQDKK